MPHSDDTLPVYKILTCSLYNLICKTKLDGQRLPSLFCRYEWFDQAHTVTK